MLSSLQSGKLFSALRAFPLLYELSSALRVFSSAFQAFSLLLLLCFLLFFLAFILLTLFSFAILILLPAFFFSFSSRISSALALISKWALGGSDFGAEGVEMEDKPTSL